MDHLRASECWCDPTIIEVTRVDGSIGRVWAHNVADLTPEGEADRMATILEAMEQVRLQTDD